MSVAKRVQLSAVWAGPVFFVLYLVGFAGFARFVPPPAPWWSAAKVAAVITDHAIQIRVGMVLGLVATTLLIPFFGVISIQIARIERGLPLLAIMQFGGDRPIAIAHPTRHNIEKQEWRSEPALASSTSDAHKDHGQADR